MPEFMISDGDAPPKYARIAPNGKSCAWTDESQASAFPTVELARAALDKACQATFDKAHAKLQACLDENSIKHERTWRGNYHYGAKHAKEAILLFLPHWIHYHWAGKSPEYRAKHFPTASRPLPDDLLDVFETFYVRGPAGWLGRAQTRSRGAAFEWRDSFAFAIGFSSREEAQAHAGHRANVVTASCVFTAVEPSGPKRALETDTVSQAIGAACEARDIRGAIQESAQARKQDAASAPSRPAGRL